MIFFFLIAQRQYYHAMYIHAFGCQKFPRLENVELIGVFHVVHDFTFNCLIILCFHTKYQEKKQERFLIFIIISNIYDFVAFYEIIRS